VLSGQINAHGGDRYGITGRHLRQNVHQEADRSCWQETGRTFLLPFLRGPGCSLGVVADQPRERPGRLARPAGFRTHWVIPVRNGLSQRTSRALGSRP
jgi:hypothetical protein